MRHIRASLSLEAERGVDFALQFSDVALGRHAIFDENHGSTMSFTFLPMDAGQFLKWKTNGRVDDSRAAFVTLVEYFKQKLGVGL